MITKEEIETYAQQLAVPGTNTGALLIDLDLDENDLSLVLNRLREIRPELQPNEAIMPKYRTIRFEAYADTIETGVDADTLLGHMMPAEILVIGAILGARATTAALNPRVDALGDKLDKLLADPLLTGE